MSADHIIYHIAGALNIMPDALPEELQERIDIVRHKLKFMENKPTVACLEWLDPLMIAGDNIDVLINVAGGIPAFTESFRIDWTDVRLQDPAVIVVMLRGLTIEETLKQIDTLLQQTGFADLQAVKNKRFYIADGQRYFYNPGTLMIDAMEILAEIIYPKQFIFGYEGEGWIRFDV